MQDGRYFVHLNISSELTYLCPFIFLVRYIKRKSTLDLDCPAKSRVIGVREWLSSDHINGWNVLLRRFAASTNVKIGGLYNVAFGLTFPAVNSGKNVFKFYIMALLLGIIGLSLLVVSHSSRLIRLLFTIERSDDWDGPTFYMQKLIASLV